MIKVNTYIVNANLKNTLLCLFFNSVRKIGKSRQVLGPKLLEQSKILSVFMSLSFLKEQEELIKKQRKALKLSNQSSKFSDIR